MIYTYHSILTPKLRCPHVIPDFYDTIIFEMNRPSASLKTLIRLTAIQPLDWIAGGDLAPDVVVHWISKDIETAQGGDVLLLGAKYLNASLIKSQTEWPGCPYPPRLCRRSRKICRRGLTYPCSSGSKRPRIYLPLPFNYLNRSTRPSHGLGRRYPHPTRSNGRGWRQSIQPCSGDD